MSTSFSAHQHPSSFLSIPNNLRKRTGMDSKQLLLPTSMPPSLVLADVEDDGHTLPKSGGVRRLSLGMFQVAYGPPLRHFSLKSFRESLRELRRSAPCAIRLLLEIYLTARTAVTVHVLAAMLLIISPAYSLYLSATILGVVRLILHASPHFLTGIRCRSRKLYCRAR